ncbi:MAG: hypothetical protein A3D19_00875 [Deltaproteobacteria bacterium RIFCSPHIGHO2_02_FULL_38_15]|nr:MAG: hypothetical protein A3D19_00875 [Deltaproteobacteria bacterium RIFCSPHIGHO2_02_FULL_38_15]
MKILKFCGKDIFAMNIKNCLCAFFVLLGGVSSLAFAGAPTQSENTASEGNLRESFHRLETWYQIASVKPLEKTQKSTLQSLLIKGGIVLTPEVSLLLGLPLVTLGSELALTNPFLGMEATLFEGLVKDFPTFVTLTGGVKIPLASQKEFVFKRTDVKIGLSTLREIHHLNLVTDTAYIIKVDSQRQQNYGNEWSLMVGSELDTGYNFSPGIHLNYRRAGGFQSEKENLSGRSLFILKPQFAYFYDSETTLTGSLAMPMGRQGIKDNLKIFGDYTIAGVGGNTFSLTFEKKF